MTVMQNATVKTFTGLSTDTKPTDAPQGSTYHAIDTGELWIFHDSMWVVDLRLSNALKMIL